MSKRLLWALLLIAISIIMLLANVHGGTDIRLIPGVALAISASKAIAFFIWLALGVVIGVLIH